MADTFRIKIAGETSEFESSLKNMNKAMKLLKSEGSSLNKALKIDPDNAKTASKMYSNLNEQLKLSRKQASETSKSLKGIDPKVDLNSFVKLSNKLQNIDTESKNINNQLDKMSKKRGADGSFKNADKQASSFGSKLDNIFSKNRTFGFIKGGVSSAFSGLSKGATVAVKGAATALKYGFAGIKAVASAAGSVISKSFVLAFRGVSAAISVVGKSSTVIFAGIRRGGSAMVTVFSKIGSAVVSAFSIAGAGVSKVFGGLSRGASGAKSMLLSVASSTASAFKSAFSGIGKVMVSTLTSPIKKIGSMLNEIVIGSLRQVGSNITNTIGSTMKSVVGSMQKTQTAVNGLKKVMTFKGIDGDFDKLSTALNKTAINTNISTEDADKFGSVLVGVGKDAETTAKIVDAAANANQAFGGSGENFSSVALALGQITSAGKVTAENMNQITDANSALGAALKSQAFDNYKKAGGTLTDFNDAVSKGKIGVDDLNQAMIDVSKKGGSAIKTLPDSLDSFKENIASKMQPAFNKITAAMTKLVDRMSDLFDTNEFKAFASYLESIDYDSFFNGVGDAIINLLKYLSKFGSSVSSIFKTVTGSASSLMGVVSSLMGFVLSKVSVVLSLVSSIASALSAAFAQSGLGTVSNTFILVINTIQSLATIVTNVLVVALQSINFNNIVLAVLNVVNGIKTLASVLLSSNIPALIFKVFNSITGNIATLDFSSILTSLMSTLDKIISVITGFAKSFQKVFESVSGAPLTLNNTLMILLGVVDTIVSKIIAIVSSLGSSVSSAFGSVDVSLFVSTFKNVVSIIEQVANIIVNVFASALKSIDFNAVIAGINTFANILKSLLSQLDSGMSNAFGGTFGLIVSTVTNAIPLLNLLSPLLQSIMDIVGKLGNSISGAFSNISFDSIYGLFNSLLGVITSVSNVITSVLVAALGKIDFNLLISAVTNVANIISGLISQLGGGLATSVGSGFGSFVNILSSLTPLLNGLTPIINAIISAVNIIGPSLSKAFANVDFNTISALFTSISSLIANSIMIIASIISKIFENIDMNVVIGFITNIINGINNLITSLGEGGLSESLNLIFGIIQSVIGIFTTIWDSIASGFENCTGKTLSFRTIIEELNSFISPILESIKTAFDNISKAFADMLGRLDTKKLGTFIQLVKDTASEITRFVSEVLVGFFESVDLDGVVEGFNSVLRVIKNLFKWINDSGIAKAIGKEIGAIVNDIAKFATDTEKMIDDLVKWGKEVGKFFDKMKDGVGKVGDWFSGIFGGNKIDAKVKNYTSPVNNSSSSVNQDNSFNITANSNMDMRALSREVARMIKSGVA